MSLPLEIQNLSVRFPGGAAPALSDFNLTLQPGEIVGLAGESGSGKSLAAFCALGLPPPNAAVAARRLRVDGIDMLGDERRRRSVRGARAAIIFQEPMSALSPTLRIGRQMRDVLEAHAGLRGAAAKAEALRLLHNVQIHDPELVLARFPFELSGGMLQRVLIAMAFATRPALVIADEITTAIDASTRGAILDLLTGVARGAGSAVLMISHDLGVIRRTCDRLVVLRSGQIIEEGPTDRVLEAPERDYTRALLAALPDRHPPRRPMLSDPPPPPPQPDAQPDLLLEVTDAVVRFARPGDVEVSAVDGVSFTLRRGESVGVIGGSGSGKTSLVRALVGLQRLSEGQVRIGGTPVVPGGGADIARRVQFVFQDAGSALDPRKPCWWLATEAASLIDGVVDTAARRELARTLFRDTGLPTAALDRPPSQLSGGQRQRLALARALAVRPQLLVLDEPTSALDVSVQAQILDLLLRLNAEGIALLMISHDLSVVRHLCERTLVVNKGRLVEDGPTLALLEAPRSDYAKALVASWRDLSLAPA